MYSIGQFSVMLNLNKKTLRYYDDIDLFKPTFVDDKNQYRYYDEFQIPVIKEILRLKEIGIPLEQIKKIMNERNFEQLHETYLLRLKEIDLLLEQLKKQKEIIEIHLKEAPAVNKTNEFLIERGYFIEDGNVYYNKINCDYDNINPAISEFYSNANGLVLTTGHIFKRSLDDNSAGFSEIFAYTTDNEKGKNIRVQTKLMCLRVICDSIICRAEAYKYLFDYIEQNAYTIHNIYEKYLMKNGKMYIEIICSTI